MKLTPQHHKAVELMVIGTNNKGISESLCIAPETVSRWRSDFGFQAELNRRLQESRNETQDRLRMLADTALSSIEAVLNSDTVQDKDRLLAAFKVLEMVRVTVPNIGSTNAKELEHDNKRMKTLYEYGI